MTTEEKLRVYILSRYNSLREFTIDADLKYSTVDSILRRGIGNSSVGNVIKICKTLNISADALADGEIVPTINYQSEVNNGRLERLEINEVISQTANRLLLSDNVTLDGKPINKEVIESIVEAMDVGVEIVKRKKR